MADAVDASDASDAVFRRTAVDVMSYPTCLLTF